MIYVRINTFIRQTIGRFSFGIKHLTKQNYNYLSLISFKSSIISSFFLLIDFRLISMIFVDINKTIKMAIPTNNNSYHLQKDIIYSIPLTTNYHKKLLINTVNLELYLILLNSLTFFIIVFAIEYTKNT